MSTEKVTKKQAEEQIIEPYVPRKRSPILKRIGKDGTVKYFARIVNPTPMQKKEIEIETIEHDLFLYMEFIESTKASMVQDLCEKEKDSKYECILKDLEKVENQKFNEVAYLVNKNIGNIKCVASKDSHIVVGVEQDQLIDVYIED